MVCLANILDKNEGEINVLFPSCSMKLSLSKSNQFIWGKHSLERREQSK